jgi:hypothetical protein
MAGSDGSSLERFIRARGIQLLGRGGSPVGHRVQSGVGYASLAGAGAFVVAGILTREYALDLAAIGPFLGGVVNLTISSAMKRKAGNGNHGAVQLSPEAKQLMSALLWKYVWSETPWYRSEGWWGASGKPGVERSHRRAQGRRYTTRFDSIPAEALDLLESAAMNYNRVQGLLEIRQSDTVLARLVPKVSLAAEETIADILHQTALVSKFPESSSALVKSIHERIHHLGEMADGIEKITLTESAFPEKLVTRTSTQEVLEELRLEQLARTELGSDRQTEPNLHERA